MTGKGSGIGRWRWIGVAAGMVLAAALVVVLAPILHPEPVVRPPQVAGQFYPASKAELSRMLDGFLGNAVDRPPRGRIRALIVPHAGYEFSGQVAARGYKLLGDRYRTVFILASNHNARAPAFTFSVSDAAYYQTPLGRVRVSRIAGELREHPLVSHVKEAHTTHIIEVQLPLLQKVLTDFEIVPIVTGRASRDQLRQLAGLISGYLDDRTLLVVSSDLSHYHPYDQAVRLDRTCIRAIESQTIEEAARCEACGLPAILVLLQVAGEKGWSSRIIDYRNSGDTSGNKGRVVGYSSIVFYDDGIAFRDKQSLLRLSREVLQSAVGSGAPSGIDRDGLSERLRRKQGCFVTLEIDGRLRGCIGHLAPQESLVQCVIDNTVNAALHDPRFRPVSPRELDRIRIEISALSVPAPLDRSSPEQLLDLLVPLEHGVILRNGGHQATYLPQVWEDLPDKAQFLSRLCRKGGLDAGCWKDPATQVLTYGATVFHEPDRRHS